MDSKKRNSIVYKAEEPLLEYEIQQPKFKGVDRDTFDFDAEFAKGLTPEEFKIEMSKRIKAYPWKK